VEKVQLIPIYAYTIQASGLLDLGMTNVVFKQVLHGFAQQPEPITFIFPGSFAPHLTVQHAFLIYQVAAVHHVVIL
jgi:hypothetical protein